MKNTLSYLFWVGAAVVALFLLFYSFSDMEVVSNQYVRETRVERDKKNEYFRSSAGSPLPISQREAFKGLLYFPYDVNYRLEATLFLLDSDSIFQMRTSDGKRKSFKKFAYADFLLQGKNIRLTIFEAKDRFSVGSLFVPFNDASNGTETYQTGRYLDIKKENINKKALILDFNNAYNPYCAYSDDYSCPIPPEENKLSVRVLAGEKKYK